MAIKLFPIGFLNGSLDSKGSWAAGGTSVNDFFEPNSGCKSQQVDTTLTSQFENHSIQTRQKIPIYRNVIYNYRDIWASEYEMIDRFYDLVDGKADRFYVIDLSQQEKATGLTKSGDNITVNVPDTHRFNTISGRSGYWVAAWKPATASLMIGKMVSLTVNASLRYTASYGDLKAFAGDIYVYPVIDCLFADSLDNFEAGENNPSTDSTGGFMKSGQTIFVQFGAG